MKSLLLATVVFLTFSPTIQELSKVENQVTFSVPKFFWTVEGSFSEITAEITFDPENLEKSSISGTAFISSIETGNSLRDEHLQGKDWFDSEKFPFIKIQSKELKKSQNQHYEGTFELTIKGQSKQQQINFTIDDGKNPQVITAAFQISLSDFNIGSGNGVDWVVGDTVMVKVILSNQTQKS